MTFDQFDTAIADIEKFMEGEGYTLDLYLADGPFYDHAHQIIGEGAGRVIVLSQPDRPPVYIAPDAIVYVRLCS